MQARLQQAARGQARQQQRCNTPAAMAALRRGAGRRALAVRAAAVGSSAPSLQLATALVPPSSDPAAFAGALYQWAATLTQSGANLPFALPLRTDKLDNGFSISLLKRAAAGGFASAGDIVATVEQEPSVGNVLIVRFFEGPVSMEGRNKPPPADPTERLEMALAGLVDVNIIMNSMPQAIRKAAAVSS